VSASLPPVGLLLVGKLAVLVLGFLIAVQGFRGYLRHDSEPMLFIGLGFVLISVGGVIDCSLFSLLGVTFPYRSGVQTLSVALGMSSVLYSMYR
jgi:uncharacterized membrane protein (UPF0136 family)